MLLQTKLIKLLEAQNHHCLISLNTVLYQLSPSIYMTQNKSSVRSYIWNHFYCMMSSTSGKTDTGLFTMKRLSNLSWAWRQSWMPHGASLWLLKYVHFSLCGEDNGVNAVWLVSLKKIKPRLLAVSAFFSKKKQCPYLEMKSLLFKLKFLNANRYNIFFLALLFLQFTPFVLNKQSIADFKCLNTQINCLRKLFNETDVFNTYEYVRIQNICLHPWNDHILFHLTVFTFVGIVQYHDFFPLSQI